MAKKIIIFNPVHTSVVYTEAGHTLGGGERREVDQLDTVGQRLLDEGELLDMTPAAKEEGRTASAKEKAPTARSGAPDQEEHA